jgi:hypothetical protein
LSTTLVIQEHGHGQEWNPRQKYRLNKSHHGKYLAVDLTRIEIDNDQNWPRIVDEALRCLAPSKDCLLTLSFQEQGNFARDSIMERIFLFCDGNVALQSVTKNTKSVTHCVRVRTSPRSMEIENLSIGIVTNGDNQEKLTRLIESIIELKSTSMLEIETVVAGPDDYALPSQIAPYVDKYISISEPEQLPAMITVKKNSIAQQCRFENILLCHDRFVFNDSLTATLIDFGGDFDVCALEASDTNGNRIPSWSSFNNDWQNGVELEAESFDENVFLQGSLFLVKKSILLRFPLNPLLYWGYGEDVEWSRRLFNHGITPKLINGGDILSVGHREGYFSWFIPISADIHVGLKPPAKRKEIQTIGFFPIQETVKLSSFTSKREAACFGLLLATRTAFVHNGMTFYSDSQKIGFSLFVEKIPVDGLEVSIEFAEASMARDLHIISYNGSEIEQSRVNCKSNVVTVSIETERIYEAGSSNLGFELSFGSHETVSIESVKLDQRPEPFKEDACQVSGLELRKYQCAGWSVTTEFGVWTNSKDALIRIPIEYQAKFVNAEIYGRLLKNENGLQKMKICCDSRILSEIELHPDDSEFVNFKVEGIEVTNGEIALSFHVNDPVSPELLGIGTDQRFLGFELHSIKLTSV